MICLQVGMIGNRHLVARTAMFAALPTGCPVPARYFATMSNKFSFGVLTKEAGSARGIK